MRFGSPIALVELPANSDPKDRTIPHHRTQARELNRRTHEGILSKLARRLTCSKSEVSPTVALPSDLPSLCRHFPDEPFFTRILAAILERAFECTYLSDHVKHLIAENYPFRHGLLLRSHRAQGPART